jgi:dolichol-phosphate mannosyltransferase
MLISIIIPAYNEQDNLEPLYRRLVAVAEKLPGYSFEFIFIDDCSSDRTPFKLESLLMKDPRVQIIRFARNCGSHAAIAAGLRFCRGDSAIAIAADLQDPPEIIPSLIRRWESGFKIVWGVRQKRLGETWITLACSRLYYRLVNRLTDVKQPPTGADVFLADRKVIKAFNSLPEKNTEIFMLLAWLGFSQTNIKYDKEARLTGYSKWNFSKRLKLFFDSLIPFSFFPIRFMSIMGGLCAACGLIYGFIVLTKWFQGNIDIPGWSSLMIVILIIGGLQLIMLGILGEYLWRTYDEARKRQRYIIEKNTLLHKNKIQTGI